jgi:hypothetical protein
VQRDDASGQPVFTLTFNSNRIVCHELYWRDASSWLGNETRFGDEIPLGEQTEVIVLDEDWVQCSTCLEAWNAEDRAIVRCPTPTCRRVGYRTGESDA